MLVASLFLIRGGFASAPWSSFLHLRAAALIKCCKTQRFSGVAPHTLAYLSCGNPLSSRGQNVSMMVRTMR